MRATTRRRRVLPPGWGAVAGIATGAALGLLVGLLLDQVALGVAVGAAAGLVVGDLSVTAADVPRARRRVVYSTALAILAAGVVVMALVLWR